MNERMSKHIGVTHLLGKKSIFSKNRTEPRHDSMWNFCAAAQIEPELQRISMPRHDFGPLNWAAAWSRKKLPPHHFSLENECLKGKKEGWQRGSDFWRPPKLVGVLGFVILERLKQRLELWKRFWSFNYLVFFLFIFLSFLLSFMAILSLCICAFTLTMSS